GAVPAGGLTAPELLRVALLPLAEALLDCGGQVLRSLVGQGLELADVALGVAGPEQLHVLSLELLELSRDARRLDAALSRDLGRDGGQVGADDRPQDVGYRDLHLLGEEGPQPGEELGNGLRGAIQA